ncbi:MAG: hypothetical protein P8K08_10440 [Fuerstiella sp.]|nr:hypothetical protein [Fuerstiella sp.]
MKTLRNDEDGVIMSAEIGLIGTILVIGMIASPVELQVAVAVGLSDLGDAIGNLDQSCKRSCVLQETSRDQGTNKRIPVCRSRRRVRLQQNRRVLPIQFSWRKEIESGKHFTQISE